MPQTDYQSKVYQSTLKTRELKASKVKECYENWPWYNRGLIAWHRIIQLRLDAITGGDLWQWPNDLMPFSTLFHDQRISRKYYNCREEFKDAVRVAIRKSMFSEELWHCLVMNWSLCAIESRFLTAVVLCNLNPVQKFLPNLRKWVTTERGYNACQSVWITAEVILGMSVRIILKRGL